MSGISINLNGIKDRYTREAIRKVQETININPMFKGEFQLYRLEYEKAGLFEVRHNLKFTPKDFIITSSIGAEAKVKPDMSTNNSFFIETQGQTKLRILAGRLEDRDIR